MSPPVDGALAITSTKLSAARASSTLQSLRCRSTYALSRSASRCAEDLPRETSGEKKVCDRPVAARLAFQRTCQRASAPVDRSTSCATVTLPDPLHPLSQVIPGAGNDKAPDLFSQVRGHVEGWRWRESNPRPPAP